VFLTTHNLMEAERLCSLVGVINRGKLLAVGRPDELRARSGGDRVEISGIGLTGHMAELLKSRGLVQEVQMAGDRLTLTLVPGASVAPVVKMLVSEGAGIEEVRKGAASLEDAFLTIMREEEENRT